MLLNKIQECFKETILHPDSNSDDFESMIAQHGGPGPENRIKIYRNNVTHSLTQALITVFPMTQKLVDEDFLKQALRAYIRKNLPSTANLTCYGSTFPDFIEAYEPAQTLAYLHDFTQLEWARHAAYHTADDSALSPVTFSQLAEDKFPDMIFKFRNSVSLITSTFPIDEIFDFCCSEEQQDMYRLSNHHCKLMVYRPALKVEMIKLEDGEHEFLAALREKRTIKQAAQSAIKSNHDFDLAAILTKHFNRGTFSDFH